MAVHIESHTQQTFHDNISKWQTVTLGKQAIEGYGTLLDYENDSRDPVKEKSFQVTIRI